MSNETQQTAVDVSELAFELYPFSISERNAFINGYNKAKEMERERIIKAVVWFDETDRRPCEIEKDAEQYYNETYGGNK
jgi:hypothetical protein